MQPEQLISGIPELARLDPEAINWNNLGGLTNQNYRLSGNGFDYILRLPRPETNRWINREAELHNLQRVVAAGVAPPFRYFDASGVMLSDNLEGAAEASVEDLKNPGLLLRVVETVKRVHQLRPAFKGRVVLRELLQRYYALLDDQARHDLTARYQQAMLLLDEDPPADSQLVASHNDLVPQNILIQDNRIWLIDWEYSSLGSPLWDLATLCNEASLDAQQANDLLDAYTGGSKDNNQAQQLDRYRTLLAFLSDCWIRAFH